MKRQLFSLIGLLALSTSLVFGQATLTQTTLSAAVAKTDTSVSVTSATGITGRGSANLINTILYIDQEAMHVLGTSGTTVSVLRGQEGTAIQSHANAAMVLAGTPAQFRQTDVSGSCTSTTLTVLPHVNLASGKIFNCVNSIWTEVAYLPRVGNDFNGTGAIIASATTIAPTAANFHVSGTTAIVNVTIPPGFTSGCLAIVPDGVFTWTAAGNISLAGTAVVNKVLFMCLDSATGKWSPSYIAFNMLPLDLQFARGLPA